MPASRDAAEGVAVRKLRPDDDRSGFRSGEPELDRFFAHYAGQNQFRHHLGTTYVAVSTTGRILGFATVTASELAPRALASVRARRPSGYRLPVLRLARLAVDEREKGRGVGALLLRAVFDLAGRMADDLGCVGVVVDAKPGAVAFHAKLGFVPLDVEGGELGDRPSPQPMFLELTQLGAASSPLKR